MKFKGKVRDVGRTLSGTPTITIEGSRMDTAAALRLAKADELDVEVRKHRKGRSLDANAYYWKLVSDLAEALHVSKPYLHNHLLRRYGQVETVGGKVAYVSIPDAYEAQKEVDESQAYHLKPTSKVAVKDGTAYRTYVLLKGSSRYDTREMAALIDGLVSECKEAGLETLPPEELERMVGLGKEAKERAHG